MWDARAISRAEPEEGSQTVTLEPVAELSLGSHVAIINLVIAPGRLLVKSNQGQLLQVTSHQPTSPAEPCLPCLA